jgi:hypothetical protein
MKREEKELELENEKRLFVKGDGFHVGCARIF